MKKIDLGRTEYISTVTPCVIADCITVYISDEANGRRRIVSVSKKDMSSELQFIFDICQSAQAALNGAVVRMVERSKK